MTAPSISNWNECRRSCSSSIAEKTSSIVLHDFDHGATGKPHSRNAAIISECDANPSQPTPPAL